ncbi:MAG: hypothetical protein PUG18_01970, partial [Lachnospiraceae bacterium]|nr:hypothetical protein [Lachnospiraceae bacterium]
CESSALFHEFLLLVGWCRRNADCGKLLRMKKSACMRFVRMNRSDRKTGPAKAGVHQKTKSMSLL